MAFSHNNNNNNDNNNNNNNNIYYLYCAILTYEYDQMRITTIRNIKYLQVVKI